jgi:hypothetical protein
MGGFSAKGLVEVYKSLGEDATGVEIGVCRGENIKQLLIECPNIGCIFGVDPWMAYKDKLTITQERAEGWYLDAKELLRNEMANLKVILIRQPSLKIAGAFRHLQLDFVFIDGNHLYEMALADCRAWWPKVRPSGVLSGHDFRPKDHAVRKAVFEFAEEVKPAKLIEVDYFSWYIRKP